MIKVLIQVEAGSRDRRLYNEKTLEFKGTRRVSVPYPYPYGFIIGTMSDDGENLDCYVISRDRLMAGSIVHCEPIGLLEQVEGDEVDHKILAAMPGQAVSLNQDLLDGARLHRARVRRLLRQRPRVRPVCGRPDRQRRMHTAKRRRLELHPWQSGHRGMTWSRCAGASHRYGRGRGLRGASEPKTLLKRIVQDPLAEDPLIQTQGLDNCLGSPDQQAGVASHVDVVRPWLFRRIPGPDVRVPPGIDEAHFLAGPQLFASRCQLAWMAAIVMKL